MKFTLEEKMSAIFNSGKSISFQNQVRRKDGEWYNRITWKHIQQPDGTVIKQSTWFGFNTIDECVEAWRSHATLERQAGDKFPEVIAGIEKFLHEHNECTDEQLHLDEGTSERTYFHYGYCIALKDALSLILNMEQPVN